MVTASSVAGSKTTVSGGDGAFAFAHLGAGTWRIRAVMTGFEAATQTVVVPPGSQNLKLELRMQPYRGPAALPTPTRIPPAPGRFPPPASGQASALAPPPPRRAPPALGALAVNGSLDNAAASPLALPVAFGNNRRGPGLLYNGDFALSWRNSGLDARSYSLGGQNTAKPGYNDLGASLQVGGPLLLPRLFDTNNAPTVFVSYARSTNRNATTQAGLMPTAAERAGDLTALGGPVLAASQISPQAAALLPLFPQPNLGSNPHYNYQTALVANQHQDALQLRAMKRLAGRNFVSGVLAVQSTRSDAPNLFGFVDRGNNLGISTLLNWRHGFSRTLWGTFTLDFSRSAVRLAPFFALRQNISGAAGIAGNDQSPQDWGPPGLAFARGISPLADGNAMRDRNLTLASGASFSWSHHQHNFTFGGDFRRLQFNQLRQQNPRGSFLFNGAATGNDFQDFLEGIPDTASLAFGNADKYLRENSSDLFLVDDWRVGDRLTLDLGARWEYSAPITELYGRLVNLDLGPNFSAAAPVVASGRLIGPLSGASYPAALMRPDRAHLQPRLALAWRPWAASSLVVRAGFGVYANTSVYQSPALALAQQAPLSTSLSRSNSAAAPLTLASAFTGGAAVGTDTFAVDPSFRVGSLQTWNASLQSDLPGELAMTLSYLGNRGSHQAQRFLPNTYPPGSANPCPACPAGFVYMASNGTSTLESGTARLQRRLVSGLAADLQYTYSHAMDDAEALGGSSPALGAVAQNWLNPAAEWARSNFDQRHKLTMATQYTTGVGLIGGGLLRGWQGALYKGWTLTTALTAASGLPLTPATLVVIPGTAMTGIRPDLTGAAVAAAPAGRHLNPAAFALPAPGNWGDAGRNSITGPNVFSLDAALQRSFQVSSQVDLDLRLDATNVLNHVSFPNWDVMVGSAQFGLPLSANPMRSVQTSLRLSF